MSGCFRSKDITQKGYDLNAKGQWVGGRCWNLAASCTKFVATIWIILNPDFPLLMTVPLLMPIISWWGWQTNTCYFQVTWWLQNGGRMRLILRKNQLIQTWIHAHTLLKEPQNTPTFILLAWNLITHVTFFFFKTTHNLSVRF